MFQELLTSFGAIEEPRQVGKVDHLLIDVLAITVCAVLAHAETFEDIALGSVYKTYAFLICSRLKQEDIG